ncbi:MAG: dihydropyrimidinase [Anaerolineaceae bacterium]|nr:dihydropyrimidinase [Anaerolineaceae bacterium]
MKKLFRNGTLITADGQKKEDILIEGEKICAVGPKLQTEDAEEINATGLFIMPGGVDAHVHLDLPMFGTVSSDDHYTGSQAAAFGGTTTLIDFISQDDHDLQKNIAAWQEKAAKAAVDIGAHANISYFDEKVAAQLKTLPQSGITSIKVFTAYNGRLRLDDGNIFKAMRVAGSAGVLTMVHAENGDVIEVMVGEALQEGHKSPIWHARTRPSWGEVEASLRTQAIGAMADAPVYLVHMNVAGEVDQLAYTRSKGLPCMGETCPQYLFFTEKELEREDGAKWICSPPMRTAEDGARLFEGLENGTIQVLATDHCPFFFDGRKPIFYDGKEVAIPGKELGKGNFTKIPNGLPGVGDRLPVFWSSAVGSGRISPSQFVALTSTNPAKIFGLYPQKGSLEIGSDADLVLWDPNFNAEYGVKFARQRTDYNLYEGWKLKGMPRQVYLRGKLLVKEGQWFGKAGDGRFLKRKSGEIL